MRFAALVLLAVAFAACNEKPQTPGGDRATARGAAGASSSDAATDGGPKLYAAGADPDEDLFGFRFAVHELPRQTGFVADPRPVIGVPGAPIFELSGATVGELVIDASGGVWRASSPTEHERVGFIEPDELARMSSLRSAAASAELARSRPTCRDCGALIAVMFMAESGAPRQVVLGVSGPSTERRACSEAETLLKWLRAVSRQVRR